MNANLQSIQQTPYSIPVTTQLGHVHLTVANLDRQIAFYQKVLGMQLHWRAGKSAGLGAGEQDILRLTEVKGAQRPRGTTGLYHFALMYPNRKELARATARLFSLRYPNSPTDHTVSESIYLDDPEGQTIELYILTLQRGTIEVKDGNLILHRTDGKPATGRDPLDLDNLFRELSPDDRLDLPLPVETTLGHVNLYEASLADTAYFYHDLLGFERGPVSPNYQMGEVGLSPERPHVVAFNTWQGEGARPASPNSQGIRYFTVELPDPAELGQVLERVRQAGIATEETAEGILVRDPGSIGVVLTFANKGTGAQN